jgi:hypothetical protein
MGDRTSAGTLIDRHDQDRNSDCLPDLPRRMSHDGYLQLTNEAVEITLLRSKARTEPVTKNKALAI